MYLNYLEDTRRKPKRIRRKGFPDGNLRVGYVWESSIPGYAPLIEAQMESVRGCHKVFHDKITYELCVESPRTQFEEMYKFLRDGDTLVVHCISCLGTTMSEAIHYVLSLLSRECILQLRHYQIDTTNPDSWDTMDGVLRGLLGFQVQDNTRESHKRWVRRQGS
jgi:hypothetical protein